MSWHPFPENGQNNLPTIGLSPLPGGYSKATDFGFLDKFAAFHPLTSRAKLNPIIQKWLSLHSTTSAAAENQKRK
jgi:hypothetical protein